MNKKSILHSIAERMDLPGESFSVQSVVEILGCSRVLIENHQGVTEYGPERIRVRVRQGTIGITGKELRLCRMGGCQLVIMGDIAGIQLEKVVKRF